MKKRESVIVFVINDKNQIALQLRSSVDTSFPLHWDFSAAGDIEINEKHAYAAQRELQEEIGIQSDIEFLEEKVYKNENSINTLYLYKTFHNGPFKPNPTEVETVAFFSVQEINIMIQSETKFHPEFSSVWRENTVRKKLLRE